METKHTKGEWKIVNSHFTYPGIDALHKKGNYSVIVCGNDLEGVQGRTEGEIIANARLIASAPELLQALNDLCEVMHPHIMKMKIKASTSNGFSEHVALAYARKVIHKATEG